MSEMKERCGPALKTAKAGEAAILRAISSLDILLSAAIKNNISAALLAAVGIRESGFRNIREIDGGPGVGVFQLTATPAYGITDKQAFNLSFAANWAANYLKSNSAYLSGKFPNFTARQLLQATAASYNIGRGGISGNPNTIDKGTTGDNYGSNVVGLMSCFKLF